MGAQREGHSPASGEQGRPQCCRRRGLARLALARVVSWEPHLSPRVLEPRVWAAAKDSCQCRSWRGWSKEPGWGGPWVQGFARMRDGVGQLCFSQEVKGEQRS